MSASDTIYRGEDVENVLITVTDSGGNAEDLTAYNNVYVHLVQGEVIKAKYVYPSEAGYNAIDNTNFATGVISIDIYASDSASFEENAYLEAEVKVVDSDRSGFESGFTDITDAVIIAQVKDSTYDD